MTFDIPCTAAQRRHLETAGLTSRELVASCTEKPKGIGRETWSRIRAACHATPQTINHAWYGLRPHLLLDGVMYECEVGAMVVEPDRIGVMITYFLQGHHARRTSRKSEARKRLVSPMFVFTGHLLWVMQPYMPGVCLVSEDSDDEGRAYKDQLTEEQRQNRVSSQHMLPPLTLEETKDRFSADEWVRVRRVLDEVSVVAQAVCPTPEP